MTSKSLPDGAKLAIRYGFPAASLGYCGPKERTKVDALKSCFTDKSCRAAQVINSLKQFEAAYAYYRLIAAANKITEPFEEPVVRAYWLGNDLLKQTTPAATRRALVRTFRKVNPVITAHPKERIPEGSFPHHSLHVLAAGPVNPTLKMDLAVKNACLIKWGRVKTISDKTVAVTSFAVKENDGGQIKLETGKDYQVEADKETLTKLKTGQTLTFHWLTACEIIPPQAAEELEFYTRTNITAINAARRKRR